MNRLLKFLLFGTFTAMVVGCAKETRPLELTSMGALFQDKAAKALIGTEHYEDALNIYVDMLEREPSKPQIHSNIGVIMAQLQKNDEALKSLQYALKLAEEQKDGPALFAVHYNLGVYYGAQKKVDEALLHYQAALDLHPSSKEIKTNIELLIQTEKQGGPGENKDQKQDQKDQSGKDKQDQNGQQKKEDPKDDKKDGKDQKPKDEEKNKGEKDQEKGEQKPKQVGKNEKYQPRPYQGDQLSEGDVKKILGELRNQEQKIRANFDKKEQKDSGHEKDW